MKIDVEKDQDFLTLAYSLQNNLSNAASVPRYYVDKIMGRKVHRKYDYGLQKWVYFLDSIQSDGVEVYLKDSVIRSNGRKPISKEKVAEIKRMRLEGHSVRSIASSVRVGRGTVEKYMKED